MAFHCSRLSGHGISRWNFSWADHFASRLPNETAKYNAADSEWTVRNEQKNLSYHFGLPSGIVAAFVVK